MSKVIDQVTEFAQTKWDSKINTEHKMHEPFSPMILETMVPKKFVDIINKDFSI